MERLQDTLARLRAELKVSDSDPESTGPAPTLPSAVVSQLKGDTIRYEAEAAKLQAQLNSLTSLPPERLAGIIQTIVEPDAALASLLSELDFASQELLKKKRTLSDDHPDCQNAKRLVDQLYEKISQRVDNLMFGLQTRLKSINAWIGTQTNKLAMTIESDIETATRTRPYWEAKRKHNDLLQFRTALQAKLASQETDLQLSKESVVEIIDFQKTPNSMPVRPNKPLNIFLGVVLGAVLGLIAGGSAAGISFLYRRNVPPKIAA